MSKISKLTFDGEVYRWIGSLNELKIFVDVTLAAKGNWSSPGGSVKLFSDINSDLKIKWYGPRSQKLVIQTDNCDHYSKLMVERSATSCLRNKESNKDISHKTNHGAMSLPIEVCNCTCSCSGKLLAADMEALEGLKMEIAILELRLSGNSYSELSSDLNSLRSKLMRKQDEMICKLYEDNMFFKSKLTKLLTFEKLTPIVAHINHENKAHVNVSTVNTSYEFPTIVNEQYTDLNSTTSNLNTVDEISIPNESMTIVNDQSTVLNLNTSLSVNTEISRENKELTCNYRKESNKEQCSVSNIDPGISDESNKEGSSPYVPVRQSNQCDNYNNIDLESSMPGKTNKVKSSVVELLSSKNQANYEQEAISDKIDVVVLSEGTNYAGQCKI
jgi:hypothetical protein